MKDILVNRHFRGILVILRLDENMSFVFTIQNHCHFCFWHECRRVCIILKKIWMGTIITGLCARSVLRQSIDN